MRDKVKIKVNKDGTAEVTEGDNTFIGEIIQSRGELKLPSRFGNRIIKVKKSKKGKK